MNDEQYFRVAFGGVITGEYDLETTKKRFAKLFRLTAEKTNRLFSGKEYVLKDQVNEEVAMNFAIRIAEIGCECYIETLPEVVMTTGTPEFEERRNGDRRTTFRRSTRPQAKAQDRRALIGRRNDDQPRISNSQHVTG